MQSHTCIWAHLQASASRFLAGNTCFNIENSNDNTFTASPSKGFQCWALLMWKMYLFACTFLRQGIGLHYAFLHQTKEHSIMKYLLLSKQVQAASTQHLISLYHKVPTNALPAHGCSELAVVLTSPAAKSNLIIPYSEWMLLAGSLSKY